MPERTLCCTVGLPYSGKTTWAIEQGVPVVNPDSIRLALFGERFIEQLEPFVWVAAEMMVRSLFFAGHHTVILDATNTTEERRARWVSEEWKTIWYAFLTDKQECLRRAYVKGDDHIVPVINSMADKLTFPEESVWVK